MFRFKFLFCCSVILRCWGTLVPCCVTWPQVAICSDNRTKLWLHSECVCVYIPPCVHLYEWVWHTVFNNAASSLEMFSFSFWNLHDIWSIMEKAQMKRGSEGCFEEVFDGRAWREELAFISHTMPHPRKTSKMPTQSHIFFLKATNFNQYESPADALFCCGVLVFSSSEDLFSAFNVTFSQPLSFKLTPPTCRLWLNEACGSPLTWHSWVSLNFVSYEDIFFKKVQL